MNKINYKNTNLFQTILGPFPDETILAGADRIFKIMEPNFKKESNDSLEVLLSPQFSSYHTSETIRSLSSEMDKKTNKKLNQSKSDVSEITVFENKSNHFADKESDDVKLLKKLSEIENSRKDMIINKIKQSPVNSSGISKIIENNSNQTAGIKTPKVKNKNISDEIIQKKIKEYSKNRKSKIPVLSKEYFKENTIKLKETILGETEVNIYEDNSRLFQIGRTQKDVENGEAFIYATLENGSSACFQIMSID